MSAAAPTDPTARPAPAGALEAVRRAVATHTPPGGRVAIADGAGSPRSVLPAVAAAAGDVGGLQAFCGWCLGEGWDALDHPDVDVAAFMGGYGMRRMLRAGRARYLPLRLGAVPAVVQSALRPDVFVVAGRIDGSSFVLGSEVGWSPAAIESGAKVVLVDDPLLPRSPGGGRFPLDGVVEVVEVARGPVAVPLPEVDDLSVALGEHVAPLIPEGATVQYGPGAVGAAVLAALAARRRRVRIWSGLVTDAVIDLQRAGLLLPGTLAGYAVGTRVLYDGIDGTHTLDRVERTHDVTALAQAGVIAVNTALQIDTTGQVVVDRVGDDAIAGVGGHGDFASGAARSVRGLSLVVTPTMRGRHPTLVERLANPASTARSDIDVVVTERGAVDLRGLDDRQRRAALVELWGPAFAGS